MDGLWHATLTSAIVLGAAFTGMACAGEETETPRAADPSEVRDALRERIRSYEQALQWGDPQQVKDYWTDDARVLLPEMTLEGDELASFVDEYYAAGGRVLSVEFSAREVFVHGGAAYELGRLEETTRVGGEEPETVRESYFLRWERGADGVWRLDRFVAVPVDAPSGG